MKRIILIVVLCSVWSQAAVTIVQSKLGASGTGTSSSTALTISTSNASFDNPTTSGNLVIVVEWYTYSIDLTSGYQVNINVDAPGHSFSTQTGAASEWRQTSPSHHAGNARVFYSNTLGSVTGPFVGNFEIPDSNTGSGSLEIALFEISGISTTACSVDGTTSCVRTSAAAHNSTGSSTTVDPGNITTTAGDFVLAALQDSSSTPTAGSGYTLSISAAVATVGETQYLLSSAGGTQSTAFTGSDTFWAARALAFIPASPASFINRHRGSVF